VKSHVWRPLLILLGVAALALIGQVFLVPKDFGVWERGYMYGWHRKGSEADWKKVRVKYRTVAYCKNCHLDKFDELQLSPHAHIMCENCHGPGGNHPADPPTLTIDRRRALCIRCHARLPYQASGRNAIRGINPSTHYPEAECVMCHYPHNPKREAKHDQPARFL
jgi:predicted CXXCH cytochrome family protein